MYLNSLYFNSKGKDKLKKKGKQRMSKKTLLIEDLVNWSEPKRVNTKNGPRLLRKASTNETFWKAWKENKATLKEAL